MKKLMLVMFLAGNAVACPTGSYEYRGDCVVDIKPITAAPVKPSDEKPPTDKMPSYQREGVQIVDAPNMAFDDAKRDAEVRSADAEGKKAAGIK